jgi:hypothetical protein
MRYYLIVTRSLLHVAIVSVLLGMIASPVGAQRRTVMRRGAPGAAVPLTDVAISLGASQYSAKVDANCEVDEKATTSNTRFYFNVLYPWFGYRPPADQPQWRFSLNISRSAQADRYEYFVFSFSDGPKAGIIQQLSAGKRMGKGTVHVMRHDKGARFEIEGRSDGGDPIHATIDCSHFSSSEKAGG